MAADGLEGKVMCGYQGWFRVPADRKQGTGNWVHYSGNRKFAPGNCSIDLWPDVSELPAGDRFDTPFRHSDGTVAQVFSSPRPTTVATHFGWMQQYGIDGVFLQRFPVDARNASFRTSMDTVLANCQQSASTTDRSWVLMYDLSGLAPSRIDEVIDDWRHLRTERQVANPQTDPAYLSHRGKPLVALWGLGFNDRPAMLAEWRKLIRFFKSEALDGGCTVMLGVPTYWRTLDRDTIGDAELHEVIKLADVVSPWTVGRFGTPAAAAQHAVNVAAPDMEWCQQQGLDYLPVAFPGFSWHNLSKARGVKAPLDAIPRRGGKFLWSQAWHYHQAGARMLYVAMFDEVDEATAIFKISNSPPVGASPFVAEPNVPSDQYLWLTGQAGALLRGDGELSETLPTRATPTARK